MQFTAAHAALDWCMANGAQPWSSFPPLIQSGIKRFEKLMLRWPQSPWQGVDL